MGARIIIIVSSAIVIVGILAFSIAPGKTMNELMTIFYGALAFMGALIGVMLETVKDGK